MTGDPLNARVRQLFANLTHSGEPSEAQPAVRRTVQGEAGRQQRGTWVRFMLQLDAGGQILAARYQAYGCPHTLAACEWLAQQVEAGGPGSLEHPADWVQKLDIPLSKLGRLLVVEDALKLAFTQIGPATENVVK